MYLLTGFINCEDKARMQGVLKKLQRSGFLSHNFQTFIQICEAADAQLFSSIIHNDDHVLHQLLPPVKTHSHNLRKRAHDFVKAYLRLFQIVLNNYRSIFQSNLINLV